MRNFKRTLLILTASFIVYVSALNETFESQQDPNLGHCHSLENGDRLTQSEFMALLVDTCRYDKLLRPGTDQPVTVRARVYVYFMQASEAQDMYFRLHFLLQLRHFDPRLVYQNHSPNRRVIIGEDQIASSIWTPHVFLSNEQKSSIMGTDKKDVLVSISPEGDVLFSRRYQAHIYCWMNLQKFPFDDQTCSLSLESWMYNSSEVRLLWEDANPVTLAPELHLTEFDLVKQWVNRSEVYADWTDPRHGGFIGNYSALTFHFKIARETGYYMMDYFIPSMMIVATSWVSFWLQADASPPRVTLGTSTMLSFITLASSQGKALPKVSYIKLSEVWFLGCTAFIFGSLVEFAFVNIIWRRTKNVELKKVNSKYIFKSTLTPRLARKELGQSQETQNNSSSLDGTSDNNRLNFNNYLTVHSTSSQFNIPTITHSYEDITVAADNDTNEEEEKSKPHTWTTMTPQEISMWIDKRSRIVFPLAFLVFNIIYFTFVYVV